MIIKTDDTTLIEEMFSRLNEAVPLNAAEKRNAIAGPCRDSVIQIVKHDFFKQYLGISKNRYRHHDLGAKFLLWATQSGEARWNHPAGVKKVQLDQFYKKDRTDPDRRQLMQNGTRDVLRVLDGMTTAFSSTDKPLLSSVGMVSVYYLLFGKRIASAQPIPIGSLLQLFNDLRKENRERAEEDEEWVDFEFLEFDRLAQSPNDSSALRFRLELLDTWVSQQEDYESDSLDNSFISSF